MSPGPKVKPVPQRWHYHRYPRSQGRRQQLESLLFNDALTGLPSRRQLERWLGDWIDPSTGTLAEPVVLIEIDPRGMTECNARYGLRAGDELLVAVARRLEVLAKTMGFIPTRSASDRFCVVYRGATLQRKLNPSEELAGQAFSLAVDLHRRLSLSEYNTDLVGDMLVEFNFGVRVLEPHHDLGPVDALLRTVFFAVLSAKRDDDVPVAMYDSATEDRYLAAIRLRLDLKQAAQRGELRLYWQLIVDANGVEVCREALLRWLHPQRGLLTPASFIDLVEQSDLAVPVGDWVLRTALSEWGLWHKGGLPTPTVSVNLSIRQLQQPGLALKIALWLREFDCPATALQLEVTESHLMQDSNVMRFNLQCLKALGVCLALDDFGTGYSSLSYLHRLPLSCLKIDRSFVAALASDTSVAQVVHSIIDLAKSLELRVVAEGVENEDQKHALQVLGVTLFQGYLFGRPEPIRSPCSAAELPEGVL